MMEEGFRERKNLGMRDEEREKDDGNQGFLEILDQIFIKAKVTNFNRVVHIAS